MVPAALAADLQARAFFETLNGANRYAILYRVHDAKKPETRAARIAKLTGGRIRRCGRGRGTHPDTGD
ncbi:YdeI/OmpD-associated family protein [Terrabacter sp. Root181]|uniref:YdeI/OmpD-associated family protein n=1 Tax=Terrabacter sp. Root181 TaxID=1736484 RepID=UPI0021011E83|nr:YdeI/OmpD-associated family protein [Terrabacter sp. Root181]